MYYLRVITQVYSTQYILTIFLGTRLQEAMLLAYKMSPLLHYTTLLKLHLAVTIHVYHK